MPKSRCTRIFPRIFLFTLGLLASVSACSSSSKRHRPNPNTTDTAQTYDLTVRGAIEARTGSSHQPSIRDLVGGTCDVLNVAFQSIGQTTFDASGEYLFSAFAADFLVDTITAPAIQTVAGFVRCTVTIGDTTRILMATLAMPLSEAQARTNAEGALIVDINTTSTAQTLLLFSGQEFNPLSATSADISSYPPEVISSNDSYTLGQFFELLTIAAESADNADEDTIVSPLATSLNAYIQAVDAWVQGDTDTFSPELLSSDVQADVAGIVTALTSMANVPAIVTLSATAPDAVENTVLVLLRAENRVELAAYTVDESTIESLATLVSSITSTATAAEQSQEIAVSVAAAVLTPDTLVAVSDSASAESIVGQVVTQLLAQNEVIDPSYATVLANALGASLTDSDFVSELAAEGTADPEQVTNLLAYIAIVQAALEVTPADSNNLDWESLFDAADLANTDYTAEGAADTYTDEIADLLEEARGIATFDTSHFDQSVFAP